VKLLPLLLACLAATAEAAAYRGMPVEAVLEQMRDGGLALFYSSDLVKPWMRVEREPRAVEPRAMLAEILAPYGIVVADGPEGTLMLVREPPRAPRYADPGKERQPCAGADRRGRREREPLPFRR
jgi:hypothetical protein